MDHALTRDYTFWTTSGKVIIKITSLRMDRMTLILMEKNSNKELLWFYIKANTAKVI